MNERDEDSPLGVPVMAPRLKGELSLPNEPVPRRSESPASELGRHPDDELGLAKQLPVGMHAPTKQELAAVESGEELEARRLYDQAMQAGLNGFSRWGRLADRTLLFAIVAFAALLGLFVFSQTFQILAVVALQPFPLQLLAYAGLIAIFLILIAFSIRLVVLFLRLRVNQQISAAQLRDLSSRAELRALVQRDKAMAKANLETYLRSYPVDQTRVAVTPGAFRFDKDTIERLRDARDYLLDQERFSDYDSWLDDFRIRFQDVLQGAADKIVQDWMKMVGLKTAISLSALIDSVIVLYCSYGMIGDLCRLYNLRMTRPGIIRLMAFSLFNAYSAGQIEDHADVLTETSANLASGLGEKLGVNFHEILGAVPYAGEALKAAGRIAADGLANALLLRKLGRTTVALLRPINPR
jgi:uncharacterized membrane protein YcjF (UPF0283 family)